MSAGAYSADKAACFPELVQALRDGRPIYPKHLHLIPSDFCNLACPGCSYRADGFRSTELYAGPGGERNPQRFIPTPQLVSILNDCKTMGTTAVEITGGGEPTLHPDLLKVMAYAQDDLGLHTALITNGLSLHRRDLLYRAAKSAWVRVSIDAATPETYAAVRPGPGSPEASRANFGRVIDNLRKLRAMRDATGAPSTCLIGAGFVVQKDNWTEIYDAVRTYRDAGADNVRISGLFTPQGDAYFDGWREPAVELERAAIADFDSPSRGFRVYGRLAEKISDLMRRPVNSRCWYMNFTLYLGADLNVYTCCNNAYASRGLIGNIRDFGGLKAMLGDPKTQEKIRSFDAKQCPQCQFTDRLAAMEKLVKSDGYVEMPRDVIHPDFI